MPDAPPRPSAPFRSSRLLTSMNFFDATLMKTQVTQSRDILYTTPEVKIQINVRLYSRKNQALSDNRDILMRSKPDNWSNKDLIVSDTYVTRHRKKFSKSGECEINLRQESFLFSTSIRSVVNPPTHSEITIIARGSNHAWEHGKNAVIY